MPSVITIGSNLDPFWDSNPGGFRLQRESFVPSVRDFIPVIIKIPRLEYSGLLFIFRVNGVDLS